MDENELVSINIKKVREHTKLSQEEFAQSLNLKRNSISLIENQKRNASDRTIKDICEKYNISELWLRTGTGDMKIPVNEKAKYADLVGGILKEKNEFRRKVYAALAKFDDSSWKVFEKFLNDITKE